jgi:hypothetical protein
MLRQTLLSAPLAALLVFYPALSFSADDARWYRVELLVFSQPAAQINENWPPTPELAYPSPLQFLIQRDQLPLTPIIPDTGAYLEDFGAAAAEPGEGVVIDPNNAEISEILTAEANNAPEPLAPINGEADIGTLLPTSFALLPRSSMEFRGKAAYMERQGGYTVLFHEHWAQLIGPKGESPHIVLPSKTEAAGWPELQGTVQLHLARYLHIETNLWLNTRDESLPQDWKMSAPPQSPYKTTAERAEIGVEEKEQKEWISGDEFKALEGDDNGLTETDEVESLPESTEVMPTTALALEQFYPYRHAVLMQQKRRMRSLEVHYLDHPLFGIVLKLTPLDEDELAALAQDEPAP